MELIYLTIAVFAATCLVCFWLDYLTGCLSEEMQQRIRTFKTFNKLAFMALKTDSRMFSLVIFNCVREERDAIIAMHYKDGTLHDPDGVYDRMERTNDAD